MKLSQFRFKLPENLVALEPSYHRDECRLMVIHRKSGRIETTKKDENGEDMLDEEGKPVFLDFRNVLDYFDEEDTFIFNDTQVFPARLYVSRPTSSSSRARSSASVTRFNKSCITAILSILCYVNYTKLAIRFNPQLLLCVIPCQRRETEIVTPMLLSQAIRHLTRAQRNNIWRTRLL